MKRLQVSGAFHTPLMKPATRPFSNALSRVGEIEAPKIPVLSAVDLVPYRNPQNIKRKLVSQVSSFLDLFIQLITAERIQTS